MPLPFDSLTLAAVCAELRTTLVNGTVEQAAQPAPLDAVVRVFRDGTVRYLLLSADPQAARVHLTVVRRDGLSPLPAFGAALRKHLLGATITDVSLPFGFGERTLRVTFTTPAGSEFHLYAETQGARSNLVLVNSEGRIVDSVKRVGKSVNRVRQTLPGLPYAAPPPQASASGDVRRDPLLPFGDDGPPFASPALAKAYLMDTWAGISPLLAREVLLRADDVLTPQSLHRFLRETLAPLQTGQWQPRVYTNERGDTQGAYPILLLSVPPAQQHARDFISLALDNAAASFLQKHNLEDARAALLTAADRAEKRRERERDDLTDALQNSSRADEYQQSGELLLATPHLFTAKADTVNVPDWYGELDADGQTPTRTLPVDPSLSLSQNAERYFARARKARAAREIVSARRDAAMDELLRLHAAREQAAQAVRVEQVDAARQSVADLLAKETPTASGKKAAAPAWDGYHIRQFTSPDGWEILVGEDAAANDFLTGKVARPGDVWLHARQAASAHAIVRVQGTGREVTQAALLYAAGLVAARSASKHAALVPVDYTFKKHVRKPRGSAPGAALYSHERTLDVAGIHG